MLILLRTFKIVCILFLLIYTPACICSDIHPQSFVNANLITEATEEEINRKESILADALMKASCKSHKKLSYYLYISDFINSFIEIPTSNVLADSTTISSRYLAGRAPIYNIKNEKAGICSASFLCMQNADNIFTDISNYLSVDNGLIVTWFTPSTLLNLELDSIVHSMVTECIVTASTKVGFNPFYGKTFNMVVSSDNEKIYFKLTRR